MIVCRTVIPLMVHGLGVIIVGLGRVIRFWFMIIGFIGWRLSGGIIGFRGRRRTVCTLRWWWTIGTVRRRKWRSVTALVTWGFGGVMMSTSMVIFTNFVRIKMHGWWIVAIVIFIVVISIIVVVF